MRGSVFVREIYVTKNICCYEHYTSEVFVNHPVVLVTTINISELRFLSQLKGLSFYHSFHLVSSSPWPFFGSLAAFVLLISNVGYFHRIVGSQSGIILGLVLLLTTMFVWWRDVIRESTWQGNHTIIVQKGLRIGFALFILSEVMFFFSIFWSFFHSSLVPAIEIGSVWPPYGLEILDPWAIPFLNTLVLLMSGVTITLAHHGLIMKSDITFFAFMFTIFLAIFFTSLQIYEYITAPFDIADGIYGTVFFFFDRVSWLSCFNRYNFYFGLFYALSFRSLFLYSSYWF